MTPPKAPDSTTPSYVASGQHSESAARRRFRWPVKLGFVILSIIVALGLMEAGLWIFAPVPYAEFMRYEPDGHIKARPRAHQEIKNTDGYTVRTNRDGFRGRDYSYEKPPGTLRIQVYGGSAAFDFAASSEEKSWPGAVQAKLHEKLGLPVEVMNLGVPGFDPFNCKINYLYTGRWYHPDAVILYEGWNGLYHYRALEKAPYRAPPGQSEHAWWQNLARATQIGRYSRPIVRRLLGRMRDDLIASEASRAADIDRPADAKVLAWDRQNFVDFANFAHSDGVLPILVSMAYIGSPESLKDEQINFNVREGCVERGFSAERGTQTMLQLAEIIKQVAQEKNAVFVDGYNAVPHDLKHIRDHVHLFDAGSEKLAQAVADALLKDARFLSVVERVRAEGQSTH